METITEPEPEPTVDHSERAHAEFSPSSLKHVKDCPAYHGKDGTNAAADKGTRIHEALELRNPGSLQDEEEVGIYDRLVKEEEEVFDNVFGGMGPDVTIIRETRLTLELDCKSLTFGTCDVFATRGGTGLLIDYKTGVSRIDEPRENMQARAYVLAAFQQNPGLGEIHFVFLVPIRDEILIGTFHRNELPALRAQLSAVISLAEETRPKWETGQIDIEDCAPNMACRFCRHEEHCPALGAVAIAVARRVSPELIPDGDLSSSATDDPDRIERLFIIAKIVENWASAIKFKALSMALEGVEFKDHKLRSMGAIKKTVESLYLAKLAEKYGLTPDEVLEAAKISLGSMSEAIHAKTPKGKKGKVVDSFEAEALDLGIVEMGPTRYSLSSR